MNKLNIGLIGCGSIGKEHAARISSKLQNCKLVAVSDVVKESAVEVGETFGAKVYKDSDSLIESSEVNAIVVTAASFAHKDPILKAISLGKPVFSEKPLAKIASDCREIVDAEIAGGKKLVQVGFMRRFDKGYRQVKQIIESGTYGFPLILHCAHRNPSVPENYDTKMAVTETCIHEIDVVHWLVDDEYVSAQVIIPTTKRGVNTMQDPQIMLLRTKKGICVDVEVFVNCEFGYDIQCEVVCEHGAINLPEPSFPTVRYSGSRITPIETDWKTRFIDAYYVELQEWVDSTLKGIVSGPTAWDGYIAAITADALLVSQKTGEIVPVITGEKPDFYI